ncbi:MAG: hypothetical protein C0410_07045 [Anaerolinea sp.]|nr:hypothetical protein [Anaerolinea sp.]
MKNGKLYRLFGTLLISAFLLSACFGSDAMLGDVGLTKSIDADGNPGEKTESFSPGDEIVFFIEITGGYKGLEADISWKKGDQVFQEDSIKLDRDSSTLDPYLGMVKLKTDSSWEKGEYQCEYFVPDQGTNSIPFTLR